MNTTGSLYTRLHKKKPTVEAISCSCSWNCPLQCRWLWRKWSCVHRWEPTQPHPRLKQQLNKVHVCARACVRAQPSLFFSLHLDLSQSVFRHARSFMHVPNLCVCVGANAARLRLLTLARWQSETLGRVDVWESRPPLGRPLACLLTSLWGVNINNSEWSQSGPPLRLLAITLGWADIAVAWKAAVDRRGGHRGGRRANVLAPRRPRGSCHRLNWGGSDALLWGKKTKKKKT